MGGSSYRHHVNVCHEAMIVYRHHSKSARPSELLNRFRDNLRRYRFAANPDHASAVELLIDFQEIEVGVVDAICPDRDFDAQLIRLFRQSSVALAHLLYFSWRGQSHGAEQWFVRLQGMIDELMI